VIFGEIADAKNETVNKEKRYRAEVRESKAKKQ
jgi:hypothetical protein